MESKIGEKIQTICQRLYAKNMLAATDGNVSYRCHDDKILITATGRAKAFMDNKDLAVINLSGQTLQGEPSGEYPMHLALYRLCPTAKAIVHAHPPTAIAWSVARPQLRELPGTCLPEVILATGVIPIIPYARPTTTQMGEVLHDFVPKHKAMILARHGALSWGEDLEEAWRGIERIEHCATILKLAEELGGLSYLPEREVEALWAMRKQIGNKTL